MAGGQKLGISISVPTLLKIVAVLGLLYLIYLVREVIGIIFATLIFASAIAPSVKKLEKIKIPRSLAILLIYLAILLVIGAAVYLIIPPIINEAKELGNNLPHYINKTSNLIFNLQNYTDKNNWPIDLQATINNLTAGLQSSTQGLIETISNFFGGLFSFFIILVMTFYLTLEQDGLKKSVAAFLPLKNRQRLLKTLDQIQQKISWWFRGQLALCVIIFLMTYMSLSIFGMKYALVLAIIAGLAEIIPYLGPTIAAVPAIFIALVQSPVLALFILLVYIIIQLVENNILVPKIMQQAIGLDPIISIVALMIGFKLAGILGAILAIPASTALMVIAKDLLLSHSTQHITHNKAKYKS